jgi:hypothetical protein
MSHTILLLGSLINRPQKLGISPSPSFEILQLIMEVISQTFFVGASLKDLASYPSKCLGFQGREA